MSLLNLRISRTMLKKALSTLMRDFAEVSMNLQPKPRATASPSIIKGMLVQCCPENDAG